MRHVSAPPASPRARCLLDRLNSLRFSLSEEFGVTFVDALHRVRAALDVTPDLNLFAKRPWYAERSDELAVAMANGEADAFHQLDLTPPAARAALLEEAGEIKCLQSFANRSFVYIHGQ